MSFYDIFNANAVVGDLVIFKEKGKSWVKNWKVTKVFKNKHKVIDFVEVTQQRRPYAKKKLDLFGMDCTVHVLAPQSEVVNNAYGDLLTKYPHLRFVRARTDNYCELLCMKCMSVLQMTQMADEVGDVQFYGDRVVQGKPEIVESREAIVCNCLRKKNTIEIIPKKETYDISVDEYY